jgi:tryptophan synthase
MGYYNPYIAYGEEKLMRDAKDAGNQQIPIMIQFPTGVDGFIVVDLPPEESENFRKLVQQYNLSFVPLAAPVTSDSRLDYINSVADSMVYCVSLLGVTGGRSELPTSLPEFVKRVKDHVDKPLAVGK